MELKWLEDFLSLADSGSFSRSAELRHISQSALSRRIHSLEIWLGANLIERSSYPTKLTPTGKRFHSLIKPVVAQLHQARALSKGLSESSSLLTFSAPHNLALRFFPNWLTQVSGNFSALKTSLFAANVHEAVLALTEGSVDLLLCYHQPSRPIILDESRYQGVHLQSDSLQLFSACNANGKAKFDLATQGQLPYLEYSPNAYLRRMSDLILEQMQDSARLDKRYETDMAEALKRMVQAGHGVAFLPLSSVEEEVQEKKLVPIGADKLKLLLNIHLYRDHHNDKAILNEFWQHLLDSGIRQV